MNILYVCSGNINRSAVAGILESHYNKSDEIISAGTGKTAAKKARIPKRMREILQREGFGEQAEAHRSLSVDKELLDWADVIYVMTPHYRKLINERFPGYNAKIKDFAPEPIPDPHFNKKYEDCFQAIKQHIEPH